MSDDIMSRYQDSVIMGGHRLHADDPEWSKALGHARRIHETLQEHYSSTFEATQPTSIKLPHQYVDGYCVPVPYRTIINVETTMAELHVLTTELDRASAEIMDEIIKARINATVERVRGSIRQYEQAARRAARAHLKVVP
jgi:hypothetical protein